MQKEPIEKGRLLRNLTLLVDISIYGFLIGTLSITNFLIVAYVDGNGISHTQNCNLLLTPECEHIFRARAACFASTTLLLLMHAYNCKDLARSLRKMKYRYVPPSLPPFLPPSLFSSSTSECEHIFKARAACFASTTLLLLMHAYNCKDLARSLRKMKYRYVPSSLPPSYHHFPLLSIHDKCLYQA